MKMKMMKKNLNFKKKILKFDRNSYSSSRNGLVDILPIYLKNLFFFESKKNLYYYSKLMALFKKIYILYIFSKALANISFSNITISSEFSKNFLNKKKDNSYYVQKERGNKSILPTNLNYYTTVSHTNLFLKNESNFAFKIKNDKHLNNNLSFYTEYLFIYNLIKNKIDFNKT